MADQEFLYRPTLVRIFSWVSFAGQHQTDFIPIFLSTFCSALLAGRQQRNQLLLYRLGGAASLNNCFFPPRLIESNCMNDPIIANCPQWQVQKLIDEKTRVDRKLYAAAQNEYRKVSRDSGCKFKLHGPPLEYAGLLIIR